MATFRPTLGKGVPTLDALKTKRQFATGGMRELAWIPAAAVVGFGTTFLLADLLEMSRYWLVFFYGITTTALFTAYVHRSRIEVMSALHRHWRWGVLGALVTGALLMVNVRSQDGSARPGGAELAWDIFWLGIVYGLLDALLLNVLPVLATWRALSRRGWTDEWIGKIGVGALAIAASALVAAAYHLGYPEFQGADVREPILGNSIMSAAFVLTNNPIAGILSHIIMHISAVFHGAEGTVQLPPHY